MQAKISMTAVYIGVMTGTSMDGLDLVAASFHPLQLHATLTVPFDEDLRDELLALTQPGDNEIDRMGIAHVALGKMIGEAVNQLIEENHLDRRQIKAIGSHGQTIRHRPENAFSLQIGDPNTITNHLTECNMGNAHTVDFIIAGLRQNEKFIS